MVERKGPPAITVGTRWRDKVENTYWTVLLTPNKAHPPREGEQLIVALGESGVPAVFDLVYWHEDFEPAGMPEGQRFMLPATLPK
jgi:hypothetical protein